MGNRYPNLRECSVPFASPDSYRKVRVIMTTLDQAAFEPRNPRIPNLHSKYPKRLKFVGLALLFSRCHKVNSEEVRSR